MSKDLELSDQEKITQCNNEFNRLLKDCIAMLLAKQKDLINATGKLGFYPNTPALSSEFQDNVLIQFPGYFIVQKNQNRDSKEKQSELVPFRKEKSLTEEEQKEALKHIAPLTAEEKKQKFNELTTGLFPNAKNNVFTDIPTLSTKQVQHLISVTGYIPFGKEGMTRTNARDKLACVTLYLEKLKEMQTQLGALSTEEQSNLLPQHMETFKNTVVQFHTDMKATIDAQKSRQNPIRFWLTRFRERFVDGIVNLLSFRQYVNPINIEDHYSSLGTARVMKNEVTRKIDLFTKRLPAKAAVVDDFEIEDEGAPAAPVNNPSVEEVEIAQAPSAAESQPLEENEPVKNAKKKAKKTYFFPPVLSTQIQTNDAEVLLKEIEDHICYAITFFSNGVNMHASLEGKAQFQELQENKIWVERFFSDVENVNLFMCAQLNAVEMAYDARGITPKSNYIQRTIHQLVTLKNIFQIIVNTASFDHLQLNELDLLRTNREEKIVLYYENHRAEIDAAYEKRKAAEAPSILRLKFE